MSMAWQGPIALKNHVLHGLVSLATSSRNVLYYIDYIYIYIYVCVCDNYDFHGSGENSMAYPKLYSKYRTNAPGLEMKMLAS